jgi:hypothetical protein
MKEKPFKRIMVELQNGMMVSISDLPKEQYEYFLELMNHVRLAYIAVTNNENPNPQT